MLIAITREVSPALEHCELTHLQRARIDLDAARAQHRRYEECLTALGCEVRRLPAEPELPDAVFVEDTCVVLDELAVVTRPGADSRKPETRSVAEALKPFRRLGFIHAPGTMDGGDVLRLGKNVFAGLSSRTNRAGIHQLRELLLPHGYTVHAVDFTGCLHLKTAVTPVGEATLLVNREWVDPGVFGDVAVIEVDPSEPYAANALLVGGTVVHPTAFPRTRTRLEGHGIRVETVDVSELAKAEAGVTCCCVLLDVEPGSPGAGA
jgi:dimethylargininase